MPGVPRIECDSGFTGTRGGDLSKLRKSGTVTSGLEAFTAPTEPARPGFPPVLSRTVSGAKKVAAPFGSLLEIAY